MKFTVTTQGPNCLGLLDICQRYVDEQWTAEHMTPEQATSAALDQFRRAVAGELEPLEVED